MSLLLTGISELTTNDPARGDGHADPGDALLGVIRDAALVVSTDGVVEWVGPVAEAPDADTRRDLGGRAVIPGFVDSHTHLVFAGDRSAEFAARMTGTPYDGGGIAVSVAATRAASDDELRALVAARVAEMRAQGTTTVEIKSGYGLTLDDELRSLRIAREVTSHTTFLGAHVVPREYAPDRAAYVDLVTGPMLDAVTADGPTTLAESIDVFCEPHSAHAFDGDEARTILEAGRAAGLSLRVHGNQLGPGPGVRLACELGARSVDHCTFLDEADVEALAAARGTTVATLLPGVEFSTRSPYPDARALIDAGVDVALASDCNPGTCYSSSIPFAIALAVREMGMTPAEALHAATAVSARSLGLDRRIAPGQPAELAVIDAPSHLHLAYRAGVPIVRALDL
ncbi:imidazolonepropionase [Terracoccus sp. 273MFTsu3.1]|uniref:imidazolonepropionase n=1 Tax=Terracoccus sp. 273MFTsu3.1 TaxID=1172188 RepID=UPI00037B617D|nr:imidazolonepropionase [Terracoccus sp. 273MFTsu3.1]